MTLLRKCDACGKVADDRRGYEDDAFISVEPDAFEDCFHACSWACVAQISLARAAEAGVKP